VSEAPQLDAVFLYMGILDAYEAVGVELIGPDVLSEHVLPRMTYYVKEFLPEVFRDRTDSESLSSDLSQFLAEFRKRVDQAREQGTAGNMTMEEIWELRAAIFGFESVFIKILGDAAIKNYVFTRMADILSAYLPDYLLDPSVPLKSKLDSYAKHLVENKFVGFARVNSGAGTYTVAANRCQFSRIHDSEAYRNLNVRFCPWGMIASAIVSSHEGRGTNLESSQFTTRGSISKIKSE
jgi:hypothetical protein